MTIAISHPRIWQLLNVLADGEFHSGEILAQQLGVSRASVFNALSEATSCGVILQRIRGRGYRLPHPWRRLEEQKIAHYLGGTAQRFTLEVLQYAASSNTLLLQRAASGLPSGSVVAVELQTAGRGRMGRVWYSGLGDALTFSLLWRFAGGLNTLSGLSLAVGVAIVRALRHFGIDAAQLRWPNDVLLPHGKLAGVLIEAQGDVLGPSAVVIGIGLNCRLPGSALAQHIAQPVSALEEACEKLPSRNYVLAVLLKALAQVLEEFAQTGFAGLRGEWERYHAHQGQPVSLQKMDGEVITGVACGVNEQGKLQLQTPQGMQRYNSGEVSGWRK
jgi:BirA family biotin operon repressor/biotin-[acetyl-CoA-carboxylase] ligase